MKLSATLVTAFSAAVLLSSPDDAPVQVHAQINPTTVNGGTVDLATCVNQQSNFNIQLVFMGSSDSGSTIDPRYTEAFEAAAARWMKVIVGDVPDLGANLVDDWFGGQFEGSSYNGAVDDLVIGYDIPATIDGPGGQMGGAGPVFVRRDSRGRPLSTISGIMFFDGADLDTMPLEDVKAIIQHEMGHVLGLVGTTNERCNTFCDSNNANQQAEYSCRFAGSEYLAIQGGNLELENAGGMGTACGHWEEDNFRTRQSSEVMTGFFEANLFQPLSSVTVAGLRDIGYSVDFCGADIWPANEDTIKRFEIYKTQQTMNMDSMMESIAPRWGVDPDTGEKTEWGNLETSMPLDRDESDTNDSSSGAYMNCLGLTISSISVLATLILL